MRNYITAVVSILLIFSMPIVKAQEATAQDSLPVTTVLGERTITGIQYDSRYVNKKLRRTDQKLTVFGYYRLFLFGRHLTEPYPNLSPFEKAYSVGDGYREPMLSMTVVGRPSGKASFGSELFFFTPYRAEGPQENVFTMNLGLNFYGNFRTKHGKYGIRAGGIHWYNLSPFTIGVFQILDRFSIFDRTPWEGVTNTEKYDNYFNTGSTSPGDLRWNNQAFQGLIINGGSLPGGFAFDLFWGKTQPGGVLAGAVSEPSLTTGGSLDAGNVPSYAGFAGLGRVLPNIITGGKIGRSFDNGKQTLFYNVLHSQQRLDSVQNLNRIFQVHSLSMDLNIAKVKVQGELGAGSYESPTYDRKWGEALMMRFYLPKEYTFLPVDFQVYQISKDFYNQNGEIFTQSNPEILEDIGGVGAGVIGVGGQIAAVNQLVHNRRGFNLNTELDLGNAVFKLGYGLSQEIEANSANITYVHIINGLALSRVYNPFPANATGPTVFGPYQRKFSFFRGVSEVMQTTDLDPLTGLPTLRKYFTSVSLQGKYKNEFFGKKFFAFYLGSFGSASRNAQFIPKIDEEAYIFAQYHEFDLYYEIFPNFLLAGYVGLEGIKGGRFTRWDEESNLPTDQIGEGYGIGFDWTMAENVGLYIRHRWLKFEDRSFALDRYKGREVTIELKTFF